MIGKEFEIVRQEIKITSTPLSLKKEKILKYILGTLILKQCVQLLIIFS